jgi:hypothetical protein
MQGFFCFFSPRTFELNQSFHVAKTKDQSIFVMKMFIVVNQKCLCKIVISFPLFFQFPNWVFQRFPKLPRLLKSLKYYQDHLIPSEDPTNQSGERAVIIHSEKAQRGFYLLMSIIQYYSKFRNSRMFFCYHQQQI